MEAIHLEELHVRFVWNVVLCSQSGAAENARSTGQRPMDDGVLSLSARQIWHDMGHKAVDHTDWLLILFSCVCYFIYLWCLIALVVWFDWFDLISIHRPPHVYIIFSKTTAKRSAMGVPLLAKCWRPPSWLHCLRSCTCKPTRATSLTSPMSARHWIWTTTVS